MKIAVVGPTYPFRGGIVHYTTLLTAYLQRQCDTRLYSFKRQYPVVLFPGRSQIDPSDAPLVEVEARRCLTPWYPWSWRQVVTDWKSWHPDQVVIQWWVPFLAPMTGWLLARARRQGIRSTLVCHNVLPHEQSRIDRLFTRWVLGQADRLIVHTTAQEALAHRVVKDCVVTVTPHPSYDSFRNEAWTREQARAQLQLTGHVLLFFGLVRPYKGLLDLINAVPLVLQKIDITLLVVGEIWSDANVYRTQVESLNLHNRVHFVDRYVSNDEAAMYFAAADGCVLPYREATGSGVLQLAFGLGVPVIATRTGGMDEVVIDGVTGLLVEPGDISGLSQAMVHYFCDECAPRFRTAIQQTQAQYGWDRLVALLLHKGD